MKGEEVGVDCGGGDELATRVVAKVRLIVGIDTGQGEDEDDVEEVRVSELQEKAQIQSKL